MPRSITHRGKKADVVAVVQYLKADRNESFGVSKGVVAAFKEKRAKLPSNVVSEAGADEFVFFDSEVRIGKSYLPGEVGLRKWPATQGNTYVTLGL